MQKTKSRADANDLAIGQRILAIRKSLGLTQTDLGTRVGFSFQQVQKYEKGRDRLSVSVLMRFSAALDVPLTALVPQAEQGGPSGYLEPDAATVGLVRAFGGIKDQELRKSVVRIVEALRAGVKAGDAQNL